MSHESPKAEVNPAIEENERKERIRVATEKLISLIEQEPGFDWLMHIYTNKGYVDLHVDKATGKFVPKENDAEQIPITSMGEEVRRSPFKFYSKVMNERRPGHFQIVFWMNLGDNPFTDRNPFLYDPRGSFFASALRVSHEAVEKNQDKNIKKYLTSFLEGKADSESRAFMESVLNVSNEKWQAEYWHWIESLER